MERNFFQYSNPPLISQKFDQNIFTTIPNRLPFSDITSHLKGIENISNNIAHNNSQKNFNDQPIENTYLFLKRKSQGEDFNTYNDIFNMKENIKIKNRETKFFNNNIKKAIYENNELIEDDVFFHDVNNKENNRNIINSNRSKISNNNESLNFDDILINSINEKKSMDKEERDKKKSLKYRQMKMSGKNRKNFDSSFNNNNYCLNNNFNKVTDAINSIRDPLRFTFGEVKNEMNVEE